MQTPILCVENLSVDFRSNRGQWTAAARDVSFDLMPGEVLGVVGESGSGKSVTGQAIMRLLPPNARVTSGRTLLYPGTTHAVDTTALSPNSRTANALRGKTFSLIFQEPMAALSPVHTIGSQIIEAIRLHRGLRGAAARKTAVELLDRVRIPKAAERIDQYAFELSGGMRQRVMIAIALAGNPHILIADEPTTALDVTTQFRILRLLREIQEEQQMSVIFISHDLGVVAQLADRVLTMHKGRVVERGDAQTVFTAPKDPYTQSLLAAVKRLDTPAERGHSQPNSDTIVDVKNLTVRFGTRRGFFGKTLTHSAVDGVSLKIRRGETLALVGESGSGKTTLGRSILRALDPSSGAVIFAPAKAPEIDLAKADRPTLAAYRPHLQMIFQDPFASLSPRMTVRNIIAEPYRALIRQDPSEIAKAVAEIAERCRISPDWLDRYPHAFSGGQRQRIGIARALIARPEFVICDEAVSALDVSIQAEILDLLVSLQLQFDLTYLFITHDMSVVRYIADRVAVMYQGRLVEVGAADQVLNTPREPYTQGLLSAVPRPDPSLRLFDKPMSPEVARR